MGDYQGNLKLEACACTAFVPSMCVGLDMAWYGGSKKDPASQQDVLLWVHRTSLSETSALQIRRLKLEHRDPEAAQLLDAIGCLCPREDFNDVPFFMGIDAPLMAEQRAHQKWTYRASDHALSQGRMAVDRRQGGSRGWHPRLQPGYPIPPRVKALVEGLQMALSARVWTPHVEKERGILLESFPSEALWSARTRGLYSVSMVDGVKAYKQQRGRWLEASEVTHLVRTVLLPLAGFLEEPKVWVAIVGQLMEWLLTDSSWQVQGRYQGGKGLDDVVDSAICLLIALCASEGRAHAWFDPEHPEDGHIAGPGPVDLFMRPPS